MKSATSENAVALLPQQETAKKTNIASNRRYELLAGGVKSLAFAGALATFGYANSFFEEQGKYELYPATAFFNVLRTFFMYRQAALGADTGPQVGLAVEILAAAAMSLAAVGCTTDETSASYAPAHILFTAIFATSTLCRLASANYFFRLSSHGFRLNPYSSRIAENLLLATTSFGAATSTFYTMINHDPSELNNNLSLGMGSAVLEAGYQWYSAYHVQFPKSTVTIEVINEDEEEEKQGLLAEESAAAAASYVPPIPRPATSASDSTSPAPRDHAKEIRIDLPPSVTPPPRSPSRADSAGILARLSAPAGSGTFNEAAAVLLSSSMLGAGTANVGVDLLTGSASAVSPDHSVQSVSPNAAEKNAATATTEPSPFSADIMLPTSQRATIVDRNQVVQTTLITVARESTTLIPRRRSV